jgi:hypothetical protein
MLLVIALLGGLGAVFSPLLFVAGGLLLVWAAGWVVRAGGARWFIW